MKDRSECESEYDEALFNELDATIDDLYPIEKAADFRKSLEEKYNSMSEWYGHNGSLTPAQRTAIENMIAGANKWLDRE